MNVLSVNMLRRTHAMKGNFKKYLFSAAYMVEDDFATLKQ